MKAFEAYNLPLKKVFSSDYQFEIPRYQRPYSWGTEQTGQLLADLEEALDRVDEQYFLGSTVLVEQDEHQHVIDGQQRLTTLTILFAVIRDLTENSKLADAVQTYLADTTDAWKPGAKPKPRLQLRPQDRAFFTQYVQTPGQIDVLVAIPDSTADSDSRRALRDNTIQLRKQLTLWTESRRVSLFEFLLDKTYLVVVSTEDQSSAYRIFSVMNARGLDLSPTDIFKSDVIGKIPGSEQAAYADIWDDHEDALGRGNFEDLFRDLRTVVSKERAKVELLKEFPAQVLADYLTNDRAREFVDTLLTPYAAAFRHAQECDFAGPGWAPVNEWLARLDQIDNRDWRAPALWALRHHQNDPEYLAAFLTRLERLAASFLLRGEYSTPRVERYLRLLRQLDDGDGLDSAAFDLVMDEKSEALDGLDGPVYRMQPRRLRYLMLRLEGMLAAGSGGSFDHKISIEHVLPQNPSEGSHWLSDFDEEQRTYWVHRLGNLLLLSRAKNSAAGRKPFVDKKQTYFQVKGGGTPFVLTTQVIEKPEWTPAVVETRQKILTGKLANEWELT